MMPLLFVAPEGQTAGGSLQAEEEVEAVLCCAAFYSAALRFLYSEWTLTKETQVNVKGSISSPRLVFVPVDTGREEERKTCRGS